MINTSFNLSNRLPAEQIEIVREVADAALKQRVGFFIVGAQARDWLLQYVYDLPVHRATNDIDFGIVVESWDEFTEIREGLISGTKFEPDKRQRQRLVHQSGLLIDLVPFGNVEQARGQIAWPPDFSIVMSTIGFREAYENAVEVRIADDLIVKVASLAGLALMKIVAWHERRFERDAQDLGLIMRHYLDAGNQDRIYSDQGDCFDLLNDEFDYSKAGARILGRDIGRLLTDTSREIVARVLSKKIDQPGADALAMAIVRTKTTYGDYDIAIAMLAEVRNGASEARRDGS